MNENAKGRAKRPLDIIALRKHIFKIKEELIVNENFKPTDDFSNQYQEYIKGDMLIVLEFVEEDMKYCGIVVNDGITKCRHIITNKLDLDMFIRDMRKLVRYAN